MNEQFFHDHGYKYLFSNPVLVRQLITSIVKENWVRNLDFSKLEKLEKEFVTEEYEGREADVIYRIAYKDREAYLYLLLEFQSRVDRFMALRVLTYVCLFYLDLLEQKNHKYEFLPPVFPVVLYNGTEKWTAPREISALIEKGSGLERYLPKFRYY